LITLKSEHQQRSLDMQASQNLPSILTLEEAADYLRLSPDTVLQEAIAGKIPGQPIGDQWRFLALQRFQGGSRKRNAESLTIIAFERGRL
jgi:excisionase family DNA binding protein